MIKRLGHNDTSPLNKYECVLPIFEGTDKKMKNIIGEIEVALEIEFQK